MGRLVKAAAHRLRGKALTNLPMKNDGSPSTTKSISEYRNSAFQNSGIVISERRNIQLRDSCHFIQEDYLMSAKQKLHQVRLNEWTVSA
jgi:hypothetical protein